MLRKRRRQIIEHQIDVPADEIVQRRSRSFIGNVEKIDAGHHLKKMAGQMGGRAHSLRGESDLTWIFLGLLDQRLKGSRLDLRTDDEDVWNAPENRYGDELRRIVSELLEEGLVDCKRAWRAGEQRVSVRVCACHIFSAYVAPGTGPIFDDDRLAPLRVQNVGDKPRQNVGSPSRWERHHDRDRRGRIYFSSQTRPAPQNGNAGCEKGSGDRGFDDCHVTIPPQRSRFGSLAAAP